MPTLGAIGLVLVWTGLISSLWNVNGNWDLGFVPPGAAVALEFPASATRKTISNNIDLSAGPALELRITGSGYSISGNGIPTCGIDASYTSGRSSLTNNILEHVTCDDIEIESAAGGELVLYGDLPATDIVTGDAGLIRFVATDASARELTIANGVTIIENSWSGTEVTVNGGALAGEGRVASITGLDGAVSPGGNASLLGFGPVHTALGDGAGALTSGDVTFNAATALEIEITGTLASQYDRLLVNGSVSLGGATLTITSAFAPPAGETTLTILENDGADAIVGTFAGLVEGATLTIAGRSATISYAGGSGNDVTLTIAAATAGSITIAPASLGSMTVGAGFSETLTASGGTAPYTFAVTGGSLPDGLALSAAGEISGMPTTAGAYAFTVTATDDTSATGTIDYAGTVAAPVPSVPPLALALLALLLAAAARRSLT